MFGATICGLLREPVCPGAHPYLRLPIAAFVCLVLPLVSPHHPKPQLRRQPCELASRAAPLIPTRFSQAENNDLFLWPNPLFLWKCYLAHHTTLKGRTTSALSSGPSLHARDLQAGPITALTPCREQSAEPHWANQSPSLALLTPRPPKVSSVSCRRLRKCRT